MRPASDVKLSVRSDRGGQDPVEGLCCDTGKVLRTHASVAAVARAHDVDAKVVCNALGMPEGGRIDGVVLRWPKFKGDRYGPYAELTLADVLTVRGEKRAGGAGGEVRAVPSMLCALRDCLPAERRLCASDMPWRCV